MSHALHEAAEVNGVLAQTPVRPTLNLSFMDVGLPPGSLEGALAGFLGHEGVLGPYLLGPDVLELGPYGLEGFVILGVGA